LNHILIDKRIFLLKKNTMKRNKLAFITILVTIHLSGFAQIKKTESDTVFLDEFFIEDIIVTANKTMEKARELPVSISTLTGYQKENKKIETLTDLTAITPGFHMPDYGSSLTSPIYIRGIGSRINEPAIALYVDDIPYFDKATFNFDLYDISRIEILRGPQGTLYGRNSLGGLIKIHTEEPHNTTGSKISLGYGTYDNRNVSLKQHIPVIKDKFLMSFAGNYSYENGYYENDFSNEMIGGKNNFSGRLKMHYILSESSDIKFVLDASKNKNNGYPYAMTSDGQSLQNVNYNHESKYKRNLATAGIVANKRWDNLKVKSITAFQLVDDHQNIDQDFTSQELFYVLQNRRNKFFTQELNLSNNTESKINYVGGIFGYYQSRDKQVDVFYGDDAVSMFNLPGEMTKLKNYDNQVMGAAVFGQISLNDFIFSDLKLTTGLRYAMEKTRLDYLYELEMMDNTSVQDELNEQMSEPVWLPKVSVQYKWNDNFSQYGTITRGYKSGGFNSTIERQQDISFGPEYSINYELGAKGSFFRSALSINGALYYIDWRDQQVYQPVPSGQGSMLKNAGESHSQGAELEIKGRPVKNLVFYSNLAYTEAKYDRYIRDEEEGIDYSGNYIPYIPRMTWNIGGNYRHQLNNSILQELRFHLSYQGTGKHYWNDENTLSEDYYGIVNLNVTAMMNNFQFSLWGKNILGADYNVFLFEFSPLQSAFAQRGMPARFGISLSTSIN
jgi:outer membrane receptor protein involved in Fe transport